MFDKKWLAAAMVSMTALAGNGWAQSQPVADATAAKVAVEAGAPAAGSEVTAAALANIKTSIQAGFHRVSKSLNIGAVSATPVPGIYLVEGSNGELLYASGNGEYIFSGDLLKVKDGGLENLTDKVRGEKALAALSAVPEKDMIIYPATGERKRIMYVFTDVDCSYCRKLHKEIPELNAGGVEVRYLAFPRGGEQAPAYQKMVSAWCAPDPKAALATLKAGNAVPSVTCENTIMDQFRLGLSLGVQGTPAVYLDDGQVIPGYRPAASLLKIMGLSKP